MVCLKELTIIQSSKSDGDSFRYNDKLLDILHQVVVLFEAQSWYFPILVSNEDIHDKRLAILTIIPLYFVSIYYIL